jgi:CheY-like chemotaxis protein
MALTLNASELGLLHPAYLVTDCHLAIRAFGPSIRRAFPDLVPGDGLLDHFTIERPVGPLDLARMLREREQIWLLGRGGLRLRGVIIEQGDELYFLVNYAPASLRSEAGYQLQMWDFSPADATLDALIAVEVQKALIAETQEVLKELADARDAAEASSAATRDYYAGLVRALWSPDEGRDRIDRFVEVLSASGPTAAVEDVVRDSTDLLYRILDDQEPAFVGSPVGGVGGIEAVVARALGVRGGMPAEVSAPAATNVLVVSGDLVDRRLLEALLAPPLVDVVVAQDGDEALAIWRERDFDLVLVDLRGTGHDGLSTARHLRDAEARLLRPRVPIVIMSHKVILDHLDAGATQHVDAFMAKPISPAELASVVSGLAGRRL